MSNWVATEMHKDAFRYARIVATDVQLGQTDAGIDHTIGVADDNLARWTETCQIPAGSQCDGFGGTLPPAWRASDRPMAIACLRLVTRLRTFRS